MLLPAAFKLDRIAPASEPRWWLSAATALLLIGYLESLCAGYKHHRASTLCALLGVTSVLQGHCYSL